MSEQKKNTIESNALKANLAETAQDVEIRPELHLLLDVVERYRGIHATLEHLLYEICHPYRNWGLLLPQLRSYVLKNSNHYVRHEQGPETFRLFVGLFLEALRDSLKNRTLMAQIIEAQLVWLEKMLAGFGEEELCRFQEGFNHYFRELIHLNEEHPRAVLLIVQGQHPMKRVAARLMEFDQRDGCTFDYEPISRLMRAILERNYEYWLTEDDPLPWFMERCGDLCRDFHSGKLFSAISHETIRIHQKTLAQIVIGSDVQGLRDILVLPAHVDLVRFYREIPSRLAEAGKESDGSSTSSANQRFAENQKLLFLFRIMDTEGLYLIHEETLREINRSLVLLVRQQTFEEIEQFLLTAFQLLKANVRRYPHTSLQCIQVLGGEVFDRGNSRMVETFLWEVVRFGFQYANVRGVDEDWQPLTNPAHLANIRVWLNLIMQEPKWCSTLFSALIINLKLSGTCVKDTDLFQRDITDLLNHPIEPIYNLAKQFTKLMPVFFNEIGAEGELREVSTELDEIHKRRDVLIHFLRKQSHVESSNLIVDFIRAIFVFWKSRKKETLISFLPEEVYAEVAVNGPFIDDQHILANRIYDELELQSLEDILAWQRPEREKYLAAQTDLAPAELRRFDLLVQMFQLLYEKYNLGFHELREASREGFPEMEGLLEVLEHCEPEQCLTALLDVLENLQETILSSEQFEVREEIYHKRHIAVDIPSVYGRYREHKFDSLSLTFRLENLAGIYLEKLPEQINLTFITRATFYRVVRALRLFIRALRMDGIVSRSLETYVSLLSSSLQIKRFSYTQYLDIFRGLSEGVKDVIYSHYTNIHQNNLSILIPQIGSENLLTRYRSLWDDDEPEDTVHRLSEAFFRDLIASTFGLQHLDNFITRIINTLERQRDVLDERMLDLLMTYNPENAISSLTHLNPYTRDLIHLGNKGYNLVMLMNEQIQVPPAFVITTEVFRCREVIYGFARAREEFMQHIRNALTELEQQTGRIYGSSDRPLLVSVRSGAAISMPGMMATIHNVGQNEEIIEESIRAEGNAYLAWDNYRRFLQSWAMVSGMRREDFQGLMNRAKEQHGVSLKLQFTPEQMRELALDYQKLIRTQGLGIPDDPWLQLVGAMEKVFESWETAKAADYRKIMDLSDAWGTTVIVQAMVFGNRNNKSGSGVVFTSHPYRKVQRVALWGDYAYGDQGEDIVSGLVTSFPISVEQAELDGRLREESLELRFPNIYQQLLDISRRLVYEKRWNPQEIEFTFEGPEAGDLYLLQTRDMITIKKKERFDVFADSPELDQAFLAKGIGVSGSALAGLAVFTEDQIHELRLNDPQTPLILIRQDTVPEDIRAVDLADGLLTSRGGQTSHASVVAVRLEKTCVVGCRQLKVYETGGYCQVGSERINFGDPVSIDGRKGLFLKGRHPIRGVMHILPL
ncbi:MAG: phosphoenolpyruvate synthase [Desulfobulbaceae bacterium]|uniref:Phosphoenolpyruvate synthase n=1 Tax=Candidatus Desulfatifera sulfidica TaxID=2841691 RepID=A0A8J6NBA1_9BACT|nr:phosphoenolpyruvate synthase [Candidatus Desulfatifera sulfidica]